MRSTDAHRNAYGHAQWLRQQVALTPHAHIREQLEEEADLVEEELGAAYALYVEASYPFDPLPFEAWIRPPK